MITHTFFSKCNTIIKDSENNTSLNPVTELNVGNTVSRILLYIDLSSLKKSVEDGDINTKNLKHIIKMTNCGSINLPLFNDSLLIGYGKKTRASSFDIIAFKIPTSWDDGRGFDYKGDYVKETHKIISKEPSNWFKARNDWEWDEYGVYFNKTLKEDLLNKYGVSDDSVIIGVQHFENGTENLEMDVTDYINKVLNNEIEYHGIGLAFAPNYESEIKEDKFISFFTHRTNTFFAPYLETNNSETVIDDRGNFHLGTKNRLYFFVTDNGQYVNLDEIPTCVIDDIEYNVIHSGKGTYYAEISLKNGEVEPNTIMYDKWGNIVLNGEILDDVEMEFVVLPMEKRIGLGKSSQNEIKFVPQLSGINDKEKLKIGDVREILIDFIEEYSYGKKSIPFSSEYRIYVKENDREIDIYPYQTIERRFDEHSFLIKTEELIPNTYHIDIKTKQGRNVRVFENVLEFDIVSNVTNFYN